MHLIGFISRRPPADLSIAMATMRKVSKVRRAVLRGWRRRGKRSAYSSLCWEIGHSNTGGRVVLVLVLVLVVTIVEVSFKQ